MRHACIPKMASTGARVEDAVWTSRQEPLLATVLSRRGDYGRAAAAGEGGTPSTSVGFSTEKYIRLADER